MSDVTMPMNGIASWPSKGSPEKPASETQVGGDHYKQYPIQPITFAMANGLNMCQSNVVKYIVRYKDKGGLQDLEKAIHFIRLLAEHEGYDRPE